MPIATYKYQFLCICTIGETEESTISMYHVTNARSETHPGWVMIKPAVAKNAVYNGDLLFGLPVAFFATTQWRGTLPNISPYPRDAIAGVNHWRVTIPFNHYKFKLFLMNEYKGNRGITQVHLLCLNKHFQSQAEKLLTTILTHKEKLLDATKLDRYFPKGKANEYTQDRIFVNVSFINPVLITENARWDMVPKHKVGYGDLVDLPFGTLYEWGLDKLKSLQQEWETLHKEGKLDQDTVINTE